MVRADPTEGGRDEHGGCPTDATPAIRAVPLDVLDDTIRPFRRQRSDRFATARHARAAVVVYDDVDLDLERAAIPTEGTLHLHAAQASGRCRLVG